MKDTMNAARCSVYFLDEDQRVTFQDIGSVEEIKKWAEILGSEVIELELNSQFRCNGSDGYLAWLDHVLDIRETANTDLNGIDYDIQILDTPQEVYEKVLESERNGHSARMLAGYCWNWIKNGENNPDIHDIQIGDFSISWNLKNTKTYAIDAGSVEQCGCIHTCQGLEFEYAGVIIGDDLRYENGRIITDPDKRAATDKSLNGRKTMMKTDPKKAEEMTERIIKNTYRTLLSRGMKGTWIYCTDPGLRDYLKEKLNQK